MKSLANITFGPADALLRIDLLKAFISGNLPVPGGGEIVDGVNDVSRKVRAAGGLVVDVQDYHPKGHSSFASSHPGKKPFDTIEMPYGIQVLWPDHAVPETGDADFVDGLDLTLANIIIRKGMNPAIDSYSAFFENDKVTITGLAAYLRAMGITRVFLVGLAYDFCVGYSALDAAREGFEAIVIKPLTRSIAMRIDTGMTAEYRTTETAIETEFASPNPNNPVLKPLVTVIEELD